MKKLEISKSNASYINNNPAGVQARRIENYNEIILPAIGELNIYAGDMSSLFGEYNSRSIGNTMALRLARRSTDKIQNRLMHQRMVAKLAVICARNLDLNVGLTKLIAGNHDIGHMFYGHGGEWFLSDAKHDLGIGGTYVHNAIAPKELIYRLGIYDQLINAIREKHPNITENELQRIRKSLWIIFDGILSHNGELSETEFKPNLGKTEADFKEEIMRCHVEEGFDRTIMPATIEGCLIRICDKMAYTPFDMLDGLYEGMIDEIDDEYIEVLTQLGIKADDIRDANAEQDEEARMKKYIGIATSLQEIFVNSVVQNSSKSVIRMDDETARLMHMVRNLNNKKIVDLEVLQEDHDIIPVAIDAAIEHFAGIIEDNAGIGELRTATNNAELRTSLESKFAGTPDEGFIRFIMTTNPAIYDFNSEMLTRIANASDSGRDMSLDRRMALEFGAEYLSTLNDFDFLAMLQSQQLITGEQYAALTKKYRDIGREGLQRGKYQPKQWKDIQSAQIQAMQDGKKPTGDDQLSL